MACVVAGVVVITVTVVDHTAVLSSGPVVFSAARQQHCLSHSSVLVSANCTLYDVAGANISCG